MYGKIKRFQVDGNKVRIDYEQISATVEAITPEIINVFLPLSGTEKPSHAIEGDKRVPVELAVDRKADELVIVTAQLQIKVGPDFKVDFYTKDGQVICRDYRGQRAPFVRRGKRPSLKKKAMQWSRISAVTG